MAAAHARSAVRVPGRRPRRVRGACRLLGRPAGPGPRGCSASPRPLGAVRTRLAADARPARRRVSHRDGAGQRRAPRRPARNGHARSHRARRASCPFRPHPVSHGPFWHCRGPFQPRRGPCPFPRTRPPTARTGRAAARSSPRRGPVRSGPPRPVSLPPPPGRTSARTSPAAARSAPPRPVLPPPAARSASARTSPVPAGSGTATAGSGTGRRPTTRHRPPSREPARPPPETGTATARRTGTATARNRHGHDRSRSQVCPTDPRPPQAHWPVRSCRPVRNHAPGQCRGLSGRGLRRHARRHRRGLSRRYGAATLPPSRFHLPGLSAGPTPSQHAGSQQKTGGRFSEATPSEVVRRRPTLPRGPPRSTIGAEGLNFRVRNGTGCFPFAMATETLWRCGARPHLGNRTVDACTRV